MLSMAGRQTQAAVSGTQTAWSATDKSANITLSGSDYIATRAAGSAYANIRGVSSAAKSSGKWYYEFTLSAQDLYAGICSTAYTTYDSNPLANALVVAAGRISSSQTYSYPNGSLIAINFTNAATICVALDIDARKIWWGIRAATTPFAITWHSGNPAATPATGGYDFSQSGNVGQSWVKFATLFTGGANVTLSSGSPIDVPSGFSIW
jgi:hypothetical protein